MPMPMPTPTPMPIANASRSNTTYLDYESITYPTLPYPTPTLSCIWARARAGDENCEPQKNARAHGGEEGSGFRPESTGREVTDRQK